MARYSRPRDEHPGDLAGYDRICSNFGRLVSNADQFCSGCGVTSSATAAPAGQSRSLPGFNYHFVQGFGWGLGFALATATIAVIFYLVAFLAMLLAGHR